MDPNQRSSETERRWATILFADITGFTALNERLDVEDAYSIVSASLKLLDGIARKHGGTVDKYLGDCIMAMFGVPLAVEEAPKAAVNAAIEMHNRIHEFNREQGLVDPLDIHTGVNSGKVVSGDVSGPVIREFSVMGDAVNIAARLKDLAPKGQIWIGEETHRHTRDTFEFRSLDALTLKGKSRKVKVFEVVSRREHLYRDVVRSGKRVSSALVGRDREMERLRRAVDELESGTGGVVSVVGEAGIGKSRLVEELRQSDAVKQATWLEGRSLSIGSKLSYHAFADLLRAWAGIEEGEDEATADAQLRRSLAELFGGNAEDLVSPLATVLGFLPSLQRQRPPTGLGGDTTEKLVIRALGLLLRRLADRQPLVVYLDDLHWADTSSVELLAALLGLAARYPILFLLAYRPGVADSVVSTLAEAMGEAGITGEEIRLAPLDRGAGERMLENLFIGGSLPHGMRALIEERASGNPFFIEQVVLSLIDSGHVEVRDGNLQAADRPGALVIPATVEELLMARIDQLPLAARQVLHIASIVGRSSHQQILASVAEDPELESQLETLRAAQLLTRWERAEEIVWEFRHPLIQEVAYEAITRAKRRDYHGRIAESIEATFAEGRPGRNGMLAYHFSLARDLEQAERYLFLAGDEAVGMAASSEALHFFQEASKLYLEIHGEGGDPAKKATLEGNIGQAQMNRGQLVKAVEHYNRALEYLGEHVPQSQLEVRLRLAPTLLAVLARLYRPRRRPPQAAPKDREAIRLMFARSHAQITTDPTRFIFDGLDTIRRLQRVDPHCVEQAAAIYSGMAGPFAYGGLSFAISRRFLKASVPLVPWDDPGELLSCRFFNFLHHYLEGDWSDAHGLDEALLQEGLRLGQLWDVVMYLDLDTERRFYRGEFAKAREQVEELAKIADLYQYDFADTSSQAYDIYLLIEHRDLEAALEAADRYFSDYPEGYSPAISLGAKAKALVMLGDLDGAEEVLERCSGVIEKSGTLMPYHLSVYARSRLMLDLALVEAGSNRAVHRRAQNSRRQAVRLAGEVAARRPEVFKLAGHLEWALGRRRRALGWWRRGLAAGEALGARPELARIRLEAGLRLAGARGGPGSLDGVSAAELLDQGRTELEGLGLGWDPEQLAERGESHR
jgi:class 3 adenylate cyclase/tetratricopeptide (TPR) repeat protein